MTQPIDREPMTTPYITQSQLDRAFPVAHSRKDAEPVAFLKLDAEGGEATIAASKLKNLAEEWLGFGQIWKNSTPLYTRPPEADKPIVKLTGCACRWDENDNRVLTCARHQGWLDVVEEWATRAKENQVVIDRLTVAQQEPNTNGTDYVSDAEFDALIAELQSITEEARATDYHDALRKATLFLNLLKSKVHEYAKDIVRLDGSCTEQYAAYTSMHSRLSEADKLLQQALEYAKLMKLYGPAMGYGNTTIDDHIAALRTYLEGKK